MQDSKRDTGVKNRLLDSVGEGEGGMIWKNNIETCIFHMWNRWPVHVWCMKQSTQSQCTGTTQRDGMGREVEGLFRIVGGGGTCTPVADSCQCMAKKKKQHTVRKHLTGSFLCAVLDLSGILCSLLRIKRRGCLQAYPGGWRIQAFPSLVFLYGEKYPLSFYEPYGKSDYLQPSYLSY